MTLLLQPMRFFAALRELARKKLVPTSLGTEQLREIDASIRRQALFSARMTQLRALQALHDGLQGMLEGKDNLATAKLKLTEQYRALGYDAEAGGFPQDKGAVPPARKGTLRDLASDKRMTLTITTNYRIAANQTFAAKGMEARRLQQWPAWELVRIGRVRTPRGFKRTKGGAMEPVPGDDWQARFVAAGGELWDKGTRMIALKTSDVWQKLGDGAGGYKDTLGNPFAPFAFGSKYGVREVARDECLLLGVLSPDEAAQKAPEDVVPQVQCKAAAAGVDPALIEAMKRDLARQEDGSIRLKRQLDRELAAADKAYRARNSMRNRVELLCMLMNARTKNPSAATRKGWITRRRQRVQIRQGADALKRAVQGKDVERAMKIPGLGFIDFLFGARGAKSKNEQGATHWGGWGVRHVDSKRGKDAIKALPVVLAKGRVLPHDLEPNKRYIKYAGWTAVVKKRQKERWSLTTFIDDDIKPRTQKPLKNKSPASSAESTGPTTQVRTGLEFPGSTHARQLFAKTGAGAAKDASVNSLRARCKALVEAMERRAAA